MDQDRYPRLAAAANRVDAGMIEPEVLPAGVELESAGARRERRLGPGLSAFDPAGRGARTGSGDRPSCGTPRGPGVLGVVAAGDAEREDNRPPADRVEVAEMLGAGPGRAVDVDPRMGVDVENGRVDAERGELGVECRSQAHRRRAARRGSDPSVIGRR